MDTSPLLVHHHLHDTAHTSGGLTSCPGLRQEDPVVERIPRKPHAAPKQVTPDITVVITSWTVCLDLILQSNSATLTVLRIPP